MKSTIPSSAFRPDIEGLRGIAVLMVVAFHCGFSGLRGGFIGVDVFFVLSGYLITRLLVKEVERASRLSLLQFYARRARRLLPASALALLMTLLAGAVILGPQELAFAGRAARATAVYASNIFFASNAADYFAPDVETNPLLHTWSLAVEEQFYLVWPLLIILGLQFWKSRKALLTLLWGLTILSLSVCLWFTAKGGTSAFYGLPARAWEFGIGGLAVLMPRGTARLSSTGWVLAGWLGLSTVLASGYYVSGNTSFPGWVAAVPVFGTIATLLAGAEQAHRGVGILLDSAPLQVLGGLSYSWYLWHWPFLVFSTALFPRISLSGKLAAAGASLLVAFITHTLVENPIRFHPRLVKSPALTLALAAVVTVCSLSSAFLSMRFAAHLADAPQMKAITAAVDDIAKLPRLQCVSLAESSEVKSCVFGDPSSAFKVILFGDSHAIQWFNPLQRMAELYGWRLTTVVKSGCPATDVSPSGGSALRESCASWRAEALRQILALRPSIVFLGNSTTYLKRNGKPLGVLGVSLEEWRNGTRRTLEALTDAGLQVVAIRDTPTSSFDIPTCLARSARRGNSSGSCNLNKSESLDDAVFEAEKTSAQGLPKVSFLDVTDRLCGANTCWAVQKGMIVYRDDNHLTGSFAESLLPELEAALPRLKAP